MTAYFDLTELLANAFSNADDWQRVPSNAGMATGSIVLQGSAIAAWANILKAALDQNRLEGLRERIAIERPEILPVFDRFAEEASKGPLDALDLPSLTNIQLRTEDLDSKKLLAALDFGVALPPTVWTIALSNGLPSRSIVDSALSHVNVGPAVARRDRFLLESSRALAPLKQRKDEVTKKLTTLQNQVSSVERTTRPYEPHPPSELTSMSHDQRSYWSDRYSKEMDQYRKDVSSYATSQGTLPKLRQACDAVLGELRQVEAAIGAREAQTNADVLPFSDDIERARDADMLLLLDGLTNSGLRAFDEGDPFKGFSVLLATGCVLEALLKIFVQPAAATEAGRRFGVATDTVSDAVRRDIAAIARRCLSGPTLVQIAMRRNNEAAAALLARLDGVPIARLEAGLDRAIGLLSQPLPKMPSLGEIEKPKELESLRQDLTSMRASMERHASEVRDELDAEAPTFAATSSAQEDANSTLAAIAATASDSKGLLEETSRFCSLLGKAGAGSSLPKYARTLCLAIRQEFLRRSGLTWSALLTKAQSTELGSVDARSAVAKHILTRYRDGRSQLEARIGDDAARLTEIAKLLAGIDERYRTTGEKYRQRIAACVSFSYVPGIALLSALWMAATASNLVALLDSDQAPYAQLRNYALGQLPWAIVGNLTSLVIAGGLWAAQYAGMLSDDYTPLLSGLTMASVAALSISIRNMRLVSGHQPKLQPGVPDSVPPPLPRNNRDEGTTGAGQDRTRSS